ncbi:MAG TPA: TonB-dependent receptor [Methylibium sp.]|uniref:TonB-dependent receptor n=1 Tax=Methylibium sp. TaxID=2067992 RepID=UPI002DBF6DC3|nr:TonB-dependent receptor [Methylibium sp.]HEU4458783.1 TonB-dependent receptor [Methylibium sp.]
MSALFRLSRLRTAALCSALPLAAAAQSEPVRLAVHQGAELDRVTVRGGRPSTLPVEIPTTTEGITAAQIERRINATDAEDALKYFPSLLVRKRYVGDHDHAVLATRASGTGNSARSLVYADGVLLSNLLGNGASFTPRWGLVTPEEIERVDVLYGPFSAAYSGNSAGAIVDYVTRMPTRLEAHLKLSGFTQKHALYGDGDRYSGRQGSASIGSKSGDFSWWFNVNRLVNTGQPITYANRLLSQGTAGNAGTPVTGAVPGANPRMQPWLLLGATNETRTEQDHAKLKFAYDLTPTLRASYTFGAWSNEVDRRHDTFLRDAAGNAVYAGTVNIDGRSYTLAASDFARGKADLVHTTHALGLKSNSSGRWDWEATASVYDFRRDRVRTATTPLPASNAGGAGTIADSKGTGWNTLAAKGIWRPGGANRERGEHIVEFGLQRDAFKLRTRVNGTADWIGGDADASVSGFGGNTTLTSFWVQDAWRFAERWRAVLGLRQERWQAANGYRAASVTPPASPAAPTPAPAFVRADYADRSESTTSPKAALSYQASETLTLKASLGRAVRMPTVSELFQGSVAGSGTIVNADPNLRPEKSWTAELSTEAELGAAGLLRGTLFFERTKDALYSQSSVADSTTMTVQNVDAIRTSGIELAHLAEDAGLRGLELQSSLTYADSIIAANAGNPASVGKRQPRVPLWRASVLASYELSDGWSASLGVRHGGRQFGALDNGDPNDFAYTGFSRFTVADLRLQYRPGGPWSLALGIDNLTDESYWAFHPYPQRTFHAELRWDL